MRQAARRVAVGAASGLGALVLAVPAYLVSAFGNPLTTLRAGALPEMPPATRPATWPLTAAPSTALAPTGDPPPIGSRGFSVLVAAFDARRGAERAEAAVRAQQLPVYVVDVPRRDGAMWRRLFVGDSRPVTKPRRRAQSCRFVPGGARHDRGAGANAGMTRAAW